MIVIMLPKMKCWEKQYFLSCLIKTNRKILKYIVYNSGVPQSNYITNTNQRCLKFLLFWLPSMVSSFYFSATLLQWQWIQCCCFLEEFGTCLQSVKSPQSWNTGNSSSDSTSVKQWLHFFNAIDDSFPYHPPCHDHNFCPSKPHQAFMIQNKKLQN